MNIETLQSHLTYCPTTGEFRRLIATNNRVKVGEISGSISYGYRTIMVNGETHKAHRLAWLYMTGSWPVAEIDHINGERDDNRWENLREATREENQHNRKLTKNNTSGAKGVYRYKRTGKWCAQCMVDGKRQHLGYFANLVEANNAVRTFRENYHGAFANHG